MGLYGMRTSPEEMQNQKKQRQKEQTWSKMRVSK